MSFLLTLAVFTALFVLTEQIRPVNTTTIDVCQGPAEVRRFWINDQEYRPTGAGCAYCARPLAVGEERCVSCGAWAS